MSGRNGTRREFLKTAAVVAGGGILTPRGFRALGQDAVLDVPRSNNHSGYEKVGWKVRSIAPLQLAHSAPLVPVSFTTW